MEIACDAVSGTEIECKLDSKRLQKERRFQGNGVHGGSKKEAGDDLLLVNSSPKTEKTACTSATQVTVHAKKMQRALPTAR